MPVRCSTPNRGWWLILFLLLPTILVECVYSAANGVPLRHPLAGHEPAPPSPPPHASPPPIIPPAPTATAAGKKPVEKAKESASREPPKLSETRQPEAFGPAKQVYSLEITVPSFSSWLPGWPEWPGRTVDVIGQALVTVQDKHYLAALWDDYMPSWSAFVTKGLIVASGLAVARYLLWPLVRDMYWGKIKVA